MGGKRSGLKYFIGRSVVAVLIGTLVVALAWSILRTYFPDVSPYWATALGAVVTVTIAPFPTPRRVPKNAARNVDRTGS